MAKLSMNLLTTIILDEYKKKEVFVKPKNNPIYLANPIVALTQEQEDVLNEGDGQTIDQYKQINSSTGLAVNYYKLLEKTGVITDLIFENKVARPLNRGGRCANLDVTFKREGVLFFVESKYLEPYYSGNESIKDSYLDISKYPIEVESNKEEWRSLFVKSTEFQYYNFSQLCRHLLALYRYSHGIKGSAYNGEKIVLQSVTWRMTPLFLDKLDSANKKEMEKRLDTLEKEKNTAIQLINDFIQKIDWSNMSFEAIYYNDILKDIDKITDYPEFCKRYFLQ